MGAPLPLSAFWFLWLGGLGIFFPYYSLYLRENAGLTGTQVGIVISMLPLVGMIAQPFWGQVADRTGSRARVLALVAAGGAAGQLNLHFTEGFGGLVVATALLAFFATAVLPMTVSVNLAAVRDAGPGAFGRNRVWGTVGFLILVAGSPFALDRLQARRGWAASGPISEPGLEAMFLVAAVLFGAAALIGLSLPRGGAVALRAARGDWRALLRHAPVVRMLAVAAVAYLFLQGPMGLFAIYVREAEGGSMHTVGLLWIPMLALEIPLIWYTGTLAARLGARGMLAMGTLAGGLRWTVCGLVDHFAAIVAVQVLHGVVVTGLVVGGPLYLEQAAPERLRSTAQGLLVMMGMGLGGIASNTASGWLLEHLGPKAPYAVGGVGALLLSALIPRLLPPPRRPPEPPEG